MTPEQFQLFLSLQAQQAAALERIADALERMTPATATAPNYQFPLEQFASFDWHSIGASIERSDQFGAAIVSWRGQQYIRRSPANKYGEAIWFSRCAGKDENGENKYERLISFKPTANMQVEPIPEKVQRYCNTSNNGGKS